MSIKPIAGISGLLELQARTKVNELVQQTQEEAEGKTQNTLPKSAAPRVKEKLNGDNVGKKGNSIRLLILFLIL